MDLYYPAMVLGIVLLLAPLFAFIAQWEWNTMHSPNSSPEES